MRPITWSLAIAVATAALLSLIPPAAQAQGQPRPATMSAQYYTPRYATYFPYNYSAPVYAPMVSSYYQPAYGYYYSGPAVTPGAVLGSYYYPVRDYYDGAASYYYNPGPMNYQPLTSNYYWSPRYWNYYYPGY
jgi:hypothetical protein